MKIRNSFVTNSSSSSFCIVHYENEEPTNKEHIREVVEKVLNIYKEFDNPEYVKKHDWKDYKIFKSNEIEGIAEAFRNECWSASGVRIPDDLHKTFESCSYLNKKMRPTKKQYEAAIKQLIELYGKEKAKDIFDIDMKYDKDNAMEFGYYDEEFQKALRADFTLITGENVFPYSCIEMLEDLLHAKQYHLG